MDLNACGVGDVQAYRALRASAPDASVAWRTRGLPEARRPCSEPGVRELAAGEPGAGQWADEDDGGVRDPQGKVSGEEAPVVAGEIESPTQAPRDEAPLRYVHRAPELRAVRGGTWERGDVFMYDTERLPQVPEDEQLPQDEGSAPQLRALQGDERENVETKVNSSERSVDEPMEDVPSRRVYSVSEIHALRHDRMLESVSGEPFAVRQREEDEGVVDGDGQLVGPSSDVMLSGKDTGASFKDLMLAPGVVRGLERAGFVTPSPVQLRGIPLGRLGVDMIAQAKSGTGKTVVFSVIALEQVVAHTTAGPAALSVLILAPTRELAHQTQCVLQDLATDIEPRPVVGLFIGGIPEREDEARLRKLRQHIAVGTPGRVKALIERGAMEVSALRLLVLDEADRLLDGSLGGAVPSICAYLPQTKQTTAFSATYSPALVAMLRSVMRNPRLVSLCDSMEADPAAGDADNGIGSGDKDAAVAHSSQPQLPQEQLPQHHHHNRSAILRGVRQLKALVTTASTPTSSERSGVQPRNAKIATLAAALSTLPFSLCIVFTNRKSDGQQCARELSSLGYATAHISGDAPQKERTSIMESVRSGRTRVLVSTDLLARGVDLEACDVVVHLDVPRDEATYLHRVGRAGRFGKHGSSIILYAGKDEAHLVAALESKLGITFRHPSTVHKDMVLIPDPAPPCASGLKRARERIHAIADGAATPASGKRTRMESAGKQMAQAQPVSTEVAIIPARCDAEVEGHSISRDKEAMPTFGCDVVKRTVTMDWPAFNTQTHELSVPRTQDDDVVWSSYAEQAYDAGYNYSFNCALRMAQELQQRLRD